MTFSFRSLLFCQLPGAFGNLALPIGLLHGLLGDLTLLLCLGADVFGNRSVLLGDCLRSGHPEAEGPTSDKRDADSARQNDHE